MADVMNVLRRGDSIEATTALINDIGEKIQKRVDMVTEESNRKWAEFEERFKAIRNEVDIQNITIEEFKGFMQ